LHTDSITSHDPIDVSVCQAIVSQNPNTAFHWSTPSLHR